MSVPNSLQWIRSNVMSGQKVKIHSMPYSSTRENLKITLDPSHGSQLQPLALAIIDSIISVSSSGAVHTVAHSHDHTKGTHVFTVHFYPKRTTQPCAAIDHAKLNEHGDDDKSGENDCENSGENSLSSKNSLFQSDPQAKHGGNGAGNSSGGGSSHVDSNSKYHHLGFGPLEKIDEIMNMLPFSNNLGDLSTNADDDDDDVVSILSWSSSAPVPSSTCTTVLEIPTSSVSSLDCWTSLEMPPSSGISLDRHLTAIRARISKYLAALSAYASVLADEFMYVVVPGKDNAMRGDVILTLNSFFFNEKKILIECDACELLALMPDTLTMHLNLEEQCKQAGMLPLCWIEPDPTDDGHPRVSECSLDCTKYTLFLEAQ